eukprot:8389730-Pyramimonas_sp.AAC.1
MRRVQVFEQRALLNARGKTCFGSPLLLRSLKIIRLALESSRIECLSPQKVSAWASRESLLPILGFVQRGPRITGRSKCAQLVCQEHSV